jgi:hypothetical protein
MDPLQQQIFSANLVVDGWVLGWTLPLLQLTSDQIDKVNHHRLATHHSIVEPLLDPVHVMHVDHALYDESNNQTVPTALCWPLTRARTG